MYCARLQLVQQYPPLDGAIVSACDLVARGCWDVKSSRHPSRCQSEAGERRCSIDLIIAHNNIVCLLQLLYFLSVQAIKAAPASGVLPAWNPSPERRPGSDAAGGSRGGGSSGGRSGDRAPGGDHPKDSMSDRNMGIMGGSNSHVAGGSWPQAGSMQLLGGSSSSSTPQPKSMISSALANMQHAGSTRDGTDTLAQYDQQEDDNKYAFLYSAARADPLEAAAACLDFVKQSQAVIGCGASGLVFPCK